ncbi:MAG: hypothetical protein AB7I19_01450 [Planctomycetota bacterium]
MRLPDLGNSIVLALSVTLGVACFLPSITGRRVARVENRALEVAIEMRRLLPKSPTLDDLNDGDLTAWTERLRANCRSADQPQSDLPQLLERVPGQSPTFANRHYLFRVALRPSEPAAPGQPRVEGQTEVYAWPKTLQPPGRSVFCITRDGVRVYTRNLIATYAGLDRAPSPGAATQRAESGSPKADRSYRSPDGERWIRF